MAFYTDHPPGRTVQLNNQDYLYFGGTTYLGLQADPEFRELLIDNIRRYGGSYGSSRLSNLRLKIYEQAEKHLAAFTGSPAALTTSSGFLAGQLMAAYFGSGPYQLFHAPNVHAAILSGGQPVFGNYDQLEAAILSYLAGNSPNGAPVLFTDSIDLSGKSYPHFKALKRLPMKQIILVADDSHGMGIIGENGGGTYRSLAALGPKELLVCGSLGKALALQGGVILGSAKRLAQFWNTPFFAGASPAPPGHMATFILAGTFYERQRLQLERNIRHFEEKCPNLGFLSHIRGYPVYAFRNEHLTSYLAAKQILVTDFPYPASGTDALSGRIVLSAHHLEADIQRLCDSLNAFSNQPAG